jgi:hypothetical protein
MSKKLFGNSAQAIPLPLRERLGEGWANEVRLLGAASRLAPSLNPSRKGREMTFPNSL